MLAETWLGVRCETQLRKDFASFGEMTSTRKESRETVKDELPSSLNLVLYLEAFIPGKKFAPASTANNGLQGTVDGERYEQEALGIKSQTQSYANNEGTSKQHCQRSSKSTEGGIFALVMLGRREIPGGRVPKLPSGPILLEPQSLCEQLQIQLFAGLPPRCFIDGDCEAATAVQQCVCYGEVAVLVEELADLEIIAHASLWFGLSLPATTTDHNKGGLSRALRKAKESDAPKVRTTFFLSLEHLKSTSSCFTTSQMARVETQSRIVDHPSQNPAEGSGLVQAGKSQEHLLEQAPLQSMNMLNESAQVPMSQAAATVDLANTSSLDSEQLLSKLGALKAVARLQLPPNAGISELAHLQMQVRETELVIGEAQALNNKLAAEAAEAVRVKVDAVLEVERETRKLVFMDEFKRNLGEPAEASMEEARCKQLQSHSEECAAELELERSENSKNAAVLEEEVAALWHRLQQQPTQAEHVLLRPPVQEETYAPNGSTDKAACGKCTHVDVEPELQRLETRWRQEIMERFDALAQAQQQVAQMQETHQRRAQARQQHEDALREKFMLARQKFRTTQKKLERTCAADVQETNLGAALPLARQKVTQQGNTLDHDARSIDELAQHLVGVESQLKPLHDAVNQELKCEAEGTNELLAQELAHHCLGLSALLQEVRLTCLGEFVDAKEVRREQELRRELHEQRKMSTLALEDRQQRTERMMVKMDEERHQELQYLEESLLATGEEFSKVEANRQKGAFSLASELSEAVVHHRKIVVQLSPAAHANQEAQQAMGVSSIVWQQLHAAEAEEQQQQQCEEQLENMRNDCERDLVELCRRHDGEMSKATLAFEEAKARLDSEASQLRLRLGDDEILESDMVHGRKQANVPSQVHAHAQDGLEYRHSLANEHLQLTIAQRNASALKAAVLQQEELLARAEVAAEETAADVLDTAEREWHDKFVGAEQDTEAARAALALQSELTAWTVLRGEQAEERLWNAHAQTESRLELSRMRRLLGEAEARLMMSTQELGEERQLSAWWQTQNEHFLNSLQEAHAQEFSMAAAEFVEASTARDLSEHDSELQWQRLHNLLLEMRMPEYQQLPPDSEDTSWPDEDVTDHG